MKKITTANVGVRIHFCVNRGCSAVAAGVVTVRLSGPSTARPTRRQPILLFPHSGRPVAMSIIKTRRNNTACPAGFG